MVPMSSKWFSRLLQQIRWILVLFAMVKKKFSLLDQKADKNYSNNDELFAKAVKW